MLLETMMILGFGGLLLGVVWLASRYGVAKHTAAEAKATLDHIAQEKADEANTAPRFGSVFDRVRAARRK